MDKKRTQHYTIRLCCLLASFVLWLYIYNFVNPIKVIKYKDVNVELKNIEVLSQFKLTILPDEKYYLTLTLTGSAEDLQNLSKDKFTLEADLEGFGFKKGDVNKIPVKIIQKPDNVQVSNIDMLFVNIRTDDLIEKRIPIKSEIIGKVKAGYFAFPTSFNPNEVLISGPATFVDKVTSVIAKVNIGNINSNIESSIALKPVDENGTEIKDVVLNSKEVDALTVVRKVKTVPVIVKTKGTVSKEYLLKSIVPIEENIEIAVDEEGDSNITSLDTVPLALGTLVGSSETQLNLVLPDGVKLISNKGSIGVKITMAKVSTKNIEIDIKTKNLADNLNVTLDKSKVNLILSGDESIINTVKENDINCYVDLSNLGEVASLVVPVTINLPKETSIVSQSLQTTKIVITKK